MISRAWVVAGLTLALGFGGAACGSNGDTAGCKEAWAVDIVDWQRAPTDDSDALLLAKELRVESAKFLAASRLGGAPKPIAALSTLLERRASLLERAGTESELQGGAPPAKSSAEASGSAQRSASTQPSPSAKRAPSAGPSASGEGQLHFSDSTYEELRTNQADVTDAWRQFETACRR